MSGSKQLGLTDLVTHALRPGGTPGAIRTRNLEIRSLSLYPLSYGGAIHPFVSDSSACGIAQRMGTGCNVARAAPMPYVYSVIPDGLSECQHTCWVVYLHHVNGFCVNAVGAHSRDDSSGDVVPSVAAVTLQAVFGADVVGE